MRGLGAFMLFFALSFSYALAGVVPEGVGLGRGDLTLNLSATYPIPGETVRAVASSYSHNLSEATLVWSLDGKKIAEGAGISEVEVVAPDLGSASKIEVIATEEGITSSAYAMIRPTEVDLLWESDSYIPPFYRGRALPSAGTSLRLEAIPRFKRPDGSYVPVSEIAFTWKRDRYAISVVSGMGKSKIVVPSPPLFGSNTISVEARTSDGVYAGAAFVRIASRDPVLILYENHPLFGIQYHHALASQNVVSEVETSFIAIPYFAEAQSPNDSRLAYEWRVNGNEIRSDSTRPSELTINASGSSGVALVELTLSHATNLFLESGGSWRIAFLGENAKLLRDPYGGNQ